MGWVRVSRALLRQMGVSWVSDRCHMGVTWEGVRLIGSVVHCCVVGSGESS